MNTSYLSSSDFLSRSLHILSCFEIPIHVLGTYCILFKTPKTMESVKWNMLTLQVFSMISDFTLSVLVCPVLMLPAFPAMFSGVLSQVDVSKEMQLYLTFTAMLLVGASIVSLFENRFYVIFSSSSWWHKTRYPFLVGQYLIAVVSMIPPVLMVPDQKIAIEVLEKDYPEILLSQHFPPLFIISLNGYCIFLAICIPSFIISYETGIFCALSFFRLRQRQNTTMLSQNTYQIQQKFLIAIIIHVTIPYITMIGPLLCFAFSITIQYHNQSLNNLAILFLSFHGVMTTIAMLSIHGPYRNAVRKLCPFGGCPKK